MRVFGILLLILVGAIAYVRLTPVKMRTRMDVPDQVGDYGVAGGFTAVRAVPDASALEKVKAALLLEPRTEIVAQDPLTFVTRSRVFGFPDITYLTLADGHLVVQGHLVYGKSDMGVNKARILRILDAL